MKKQQTLEKYNALLQEYNQQTRIIVWGNEITLNNGITLGGSSRRRFLNRITSKEKIWIKNTDALLAGRITEDEIRSNICRKGGQKCWEKHSSRIVENLNTGTPWNKDMKGVYPYKPPPMSDEDKRRISEQNSGEKNGMFGKKMSNEGKEYLSKLMKDKILQGKFTPNTNNRQTHYEVTFAGKKFRSSWEAVFYAANLDFEYETLRIPYMFNGKEYIYIVDFVNHTAKIAVEVKPKELLTDQKTVAKLAALKSWSETNGYQYKIVSQNEIKELVEIIDITQFDSTTKVKIAGIK